MDGSPLVPPVSHKININVHFWRCLRRIWTDVPVVDEFIKGFQVFDKAGNGFIGAGELRYVLTQLGEKMADDEVDELLKGFPVQWVVTVRIQAGYLYWWND